MRAKKEPGGATPGNGTGRNARALLSTLIIPQDGLDCQALDALERAGIHLANAGSLLSDPDPEALGWALDLLSLAHQALDLDRPQEVNNHDTN